jgi:hypothetical protein
MADENIVKGEAARNARPTGQWCRCESISQWVETFGCFTKTASQVENSGSPAGNSLARDIRQDTYAYGREEQLWQPQLESSFV